MTTQSASQLNESRNAVAVIRALHVNHDEQLAQEIIDTQVEDLAAFVMALEATCCAALRVLDQTERLTNGITGASLLAHLSTQMASAEGIDV